MNVKTDVIKWTIGMIVIVIVMSLAGRHYTANMCFLGAVNAVKHGDFKAALSLSNKAISKESRYFKAYYVRASILYVLGKKRAALSDLIVCENLVPNFAETRKLIKHIDYEMRKK